MKMGGLQDDSWIVVVMNGGDEVGGSDEVGSGEVSSSLN
jgi:hypothetical protein